MAQAGGLRVATRPPSPLELDEDEPEEEDEDELDDELEDSLDDGISTGARGRGADHSSDVGGLRVAVRPPFPELELPELELPELLDPELLSAPELEDPLDFGEASRVVRDPVAPLVPSEPDL